MALVYDYKAVGQVYHKLTDGFLPREEPAKPAHWTDKIETVDKVISFTKSEMDVPNRSLQCMRYCETFYDRYSRLVHHYLTNTDYFDPATAFTLNPATIDAELLNLERHARISPDKVISFRKDFACYIHRYQALHQSKLPKWDEIQLIREFCLTVYDAVLKEQAQKADQPF